MIYAIGKPGEPVRMWVDTDEPARPWLQRQLGEIVRRAEVRLSWASISADGTTVIAGAAPVIYEANRVRARRTALLSASDWAVKSSSGLPEEERSRWMAYQQALRDIPEKQPNATPETVVWPSPPAPEALPLEAKLIARVKSEAERRKLGPLSNGFGKAQEYALKAKEATASAGVVATVLNALTAANAAAQYPMAQAERLVTGETLAAVLARYRTAKAFSDAEVARLSAIEWKSVQAIKAATSAAAKQAAYAAINWS